MKHLISFLCVLVLFFPACKPFEADKEGLNDKSDRRRAKRDKRDDDEKDSRVIASGEEDLEKEIADLKGSADDGLAKAKRLLTDKGFLAKLNKCEGNGAPDNIIGVGLGIFGVKSPTQKLRDCLIDEFRKTSKSICDKKFELEARAYDIDDRSARRQYDDAVDRIDDIHRDFQDKVSRLADSSDKLHDKITDRRRRKSGILAKSFYWFTEEESESLVSVFDQASRRNCEEFDGSYNRDRDDDRRSRRSKSSKSKRRSRR